MLVQFKTLDDTLWQADFEKLTWQKICPQNGQNILDRKTLEQEYEVLESGTLIPQTMGVYALSGRKPPDLCSLGHMFVGKGEMITICLRANVEIKDFTMPVPIQTISYQVISALPQPEIRSMTRTVQVR